MIKNVGRLLLSVSVQFACIAPLSAAYISFRSTPTVGLPGYNTYVLTGNAAAS